MLQPCFPTQKRSFFFWPVLHSGQEGVIMVTVWLLTCYFLDKILVRNVKNVSKMTRKSENCSVLSPDDEFVNTSTKFTFSLKVCRDHVEISFGEKRRSFTGGGYAWWVKNVWRKSSSNRFWIIHVDTYKNTLYDYCLRQHLLFLLKLSTWHNKKMFAAKKCLLLLRLKKLFTTYLLARMVYNYG